MEFENVLNIIVLYAGWDVIMGIDKSLIISMSRSRYQSYTLSSCSPIGSCLYIIHDNIQLVVASCQYERM
jgi:hypothetical protein